MATGTDFRSFVPDVTTVDDISDYVGHPLAFQYMFKRKIFKQERDDFHNFEIDIDQIDRLYAIDRITNGDEFEGSYYLLCRMKYKDKNVFVELFAYSIEPGGFENQGIGEIFVTANANIFYNNISVKNKESILTWLHEDNYDIIIYPEKQVDSPHKLMYMCHKVIMDNHHRLAHYPEVLPESLTKSLNEFITINDATLSEDEYSNRSSPIPLD